MIKSQLMIFFVFLTSSVIYAEQQDDWTSHWFLGAQFAKEREFRKSIDEYTKAINLLQPSVIPNHLYLYNERGDIYFKNQDFQNSIQDFNFVLNTPNIDQEDKANALWGRSRAFLALGGLKDFENDVNNLEK